MLRFFDGGFLTDNFRYGILTEIFWRRISATHFQHIIVDGEFRLRIFDDEFLDDLLATDFLTNSRTNLLTNFRSNF